MYWLISGFLLSPWKVTKLSLMFCLLCILFDNTAATYNQRKDRQNYSLKKYGTLIEGGDASDQVDKGWLHVTERTMN